MSNDTSQKKTPVTMTAEQWWAKGTELFGSNPLYWRFVCPCCGHVQKPEDFRPYKEAGCTYDTAYFNCIGRYDGHTENTIFSGNAPCNYTSGGLFNFNPVTVIDGDSDYKVFAFDEAQTNQGE